MTMINTLARFIAKIAICLVFGIGSTFSYGSNDHTSHTGHSDVLLEILQLKIKIVRLQSQYSSNNKLMDSTANMHKQAIAFNKATGLLQQYVAIPESRYPNLEMYHQSLTSRAGLMQEFSVLLSTYQQQLTNHLKN